MTWEAAGGLGVIVLVLLALIRGFEVRMVLLLGAFALAALGGQAEQILIVFFQGLADPSFVVPICSAMGFAYVIRAFECDRHLVLALTRPLLRVRWLLIPGTIIIGFLVNITIISQTSTALAVGTVLVPLLRGFGFRATLIGAALLLGSSLGGELLNPGAPELRTIADKLGIRSQDLTPLVRSVVFIHLGVTTLVFLWWLRKEGSPPGPGVAAVAEQPRLNWLKAAVPVVPLVLLFMQLPHEALHWPVNWIMQEGEPRGLYSSRLIGLAMLGGCLVACLAAPRRAGSVATHFFEGAGYGYVHIISLIVIAKCFSEGIRLSGVTDVVGIMAKEMPVLLVPLAALLPLSLAFLSGSGIGATQGLYPPLADIAKAQGMDPAWIGVVCCIGSAAGRTMSPVAAVAIMSGRLTDSTSLDLSRRVAVPLLVGMAVIILLISLRLVVFV